MVLLYGIRLVTNWKNIGSISTMCLLNLLWVRCDLYHPIPVCPLVLMFTKYLPQDFLQFYLNTPKIFCHYTITIYGAIRTSFPKYAISYYLSAKPPLAYHKRHMMLLNIWPTQTYDDVNAFLYGTLK